MPNLFPQLLAAVFSCIFHGISSSPLLQLSIVGLSLPSQVTVSPGLLKHVMCSRNVRLVPSPVISHSPSRGAAAPLKLGCRAHVLQAPSVHLIEDSLSLKSTFKSSIFNMAVSTDSFVQKERGILAHSGEKTHQRLIPP